MKRLALILSLLVSLNAWAFPGIGNIGTAATNPAANAVLVQTSALTSGSSSANWTITIAYSCTVAATLQFQVMNGASAVNSMYLLCPAGITQQFSVPGISFSIPNGDTLRVINISSLTGTVQASIFYALETIN